MTRSGNDFGRDAPNATAEMIELLLADVRCWPQMRTISETKTPSAASEIQLVTIRRLHPKGAGPNWKV